MSRPALPAPDRLAGALVGQCIGDALGFVVEGASPRICREYLEALQARGFLLEARREPYAIGQYSDDSQLAREMLLSFVGCGGRWNPADYARRIADLFREGRIVGPGRATREAAQRLMAGVPWDAAGTPPPSAGNGSAMRAGAVALIAWGDEACAWQEVAREQGMITHQDPRCVAGSVAVAGAVGLALEGRVAPEPVLGALVEWVAPWSPDLARGLEALGEWLRLPPEQAAPRITQVGWRPGASEGVLQPPLDPSGPGHPAHGPWGKEPPSPEAGLSPFVIPSVLWSLYAFLRTPGDFLQVMTTAIAAGGDTDTTAAMAGAMAGAFVGLEGLPFFPAHLIHDQEGWRYEDLVALAHAVWEMRNQRGV